MCSVTGCESWRRGAQCFTLPQDPAVSCQWLRFVTQTDGQHQESSRDDIAVCREHFLEECFEKPADTDKVQLRPGAVPTVRIKAEEAGEFGICPQMGNPEDDFLKRKGTVTSNKDLVPINKLVLAKEEQFGMEIKETFPNEEQEDGDKSNIFPIGKLLVVKEEESEKDGEQQGGSDGHVSLDKDCMVQRKNKDITEEDTKVPNYVDMPNEVRRSAWQLCNECGYFCHPDRVHICEYKLKPFACNTCGKRFFTMLSLNMHCHVHGNSKIHTCKYCYAPFKTKQEKLNHQVTHKTTLDPFQCHTCPARFTTFLERKEHQETHLEPRKHRCEECGITFTRRHYLVRHMFVHTGEKPFKCLICERGFNQPGHLKSHLRLHTGETPYKCQHCDKSFNHNVSLKSHIQRCHPNKRSNNTDDAHDSNDTESDSGDEQDADEVKEHDVTIMAKIKRLSTGRPKGRPKRNFDEASPKRKKTIRKSRKRDEESDELSDSNSSNEKEEQEMEKASRRRSSRLESYSDPDYKPGRKTKK